jgi:Kelch motif
VNQTLSLDFSKSWDNNTFPNVRTIPKSSCPSLNEIILWPDPTNNSFYAYGGELSYLVPFASSSTVPLESFWIFKADGNGGGSWSQLDMSDNPTWISLTRTAGGLWAASRNAGFNLGGYAGSRTSQRTGIDGFIPIPGLQTYNYTTGGWTNNSALGYSTFGTAQAGGMVHVPTWGPAGLLVMVGGQTSPLNTWSDGGTMVPMSNITVFDPQSQTWYHQTALGEVPSQRTRFCTVGVRGGDNSTYEIYLYGGLVGGGIFGGGNQTDAAVQQNAGMDEVYVLSLPGFVWFKANYTSKDPRVLHTCHLVGGRQLLSVGGTTSSFVNLAASYNDTDPYPYGMKVFDMTEMQWAEGFNATAAPYVPPDAITAYYSQNGKFPSKWTDPGLKDLFSPTHSPTPTPIPTPPPSPPPKPQKTPTGAIVGGAIGGVGLVALIALALITHFRHIKRSSHTAYEADTIKRHVHELERAERPVEMGPSRFATELMGTEIIKPRLDSEIDKPKLEIK